MKVSLDGGGSFVDAPLGVRVIYENVFVPGEDGDGEFHVNLTDEGIIQDVWASRESSLDHNVATSSKMVEDIVSRMVEADA